MPKKVHDKLERQAEKKGYTGERKKRYIYGTMNKKGLLGKPEDSLPKKTK